MKIKIRKKINGEKKMTESILDKKIEAIDLEINKMKKQLEEKEAKREALIKVGDAAMPIIDILTMMDEYRKSTITNKTELLNAIEKEIMTALEQAD